MAVDIPQFPHNDEQLKTIAILGYTGVGKTSVITAAYSENIIYGKDAFTQRFFQRIQEEMRLYGQIPLTMGEAFTLSFIEPHSRTEFTVQDFSGEHIKLERKNEQNYHNLIVRADNAHALICMISAQSFYRQEQIHEEVDAIQTFVNRLRGLGTRIPVVVVLTKCDSVPRFYFQFPIIRSLCRLISYLFPLPPQYGLDITRMRFSNIFAGLDFKGKGPRTVFMGISLPRLAKLKARQWPKGLKWLGWLARKIFINTKFLFQKNYQLQEPFSFCFQAFQLSILRNLLVRHHEETEYCQQLLERFKQDLIAANPFGAHFYFQDYFDRILDDTKSLIAEMEEEIASLSSMAERLLVHERELGQNLPIWLGQAQEKICKFHKPWSEGARKSLETLRHDTLAKIRDRLKERITATLEERGEATFYRLIEILKIRREIAELDIWKSEDIILPEVESFQKRLLEHFITLTLSRAELPMARFQEDRNKYLEVITIAAPPEMSTLEEFANAAVNLQTNLNQYQVGARDWDRQMLPALESFQQKWLELGRHFDLSPQCNLRKHIEKKVLETLQQEAGHFKSLAQILNWATKAEQVLSCEGSREALQKVVEAARQQSNSLLRQTLEELTARAQKCWDAPRQFPSRLKEWLGECRQRQDYLKMVAGTKGIEDLEALQRRILSQTKDFLDEMVKKSLNESLQKLQQRKEDRGAFMAVVETLSLCHEMERLDLLSQYGLLLPSVSELEKSAFHHLMLITLLRSGLTYPVYEEDRARFVAVAREEQLYLNSLDALVRAFDAVQKGGREMHSLPVSEWESHILAPVRAFHHSWLEVAGRFELPQETAARREVEQIAVRSLKDHASNLKLREMRDWAGALYPLFQIPKYRQELDDLSRNTESEIRTHLKAGLDEFMERCQNLTIAAQNMGKYPAEADEMWQKFSGSVSELAYHIEKFPHAELTLDENIQKILEHEGPERVKKTLEDWMQSLKQNRMLSARRCQAIGDVVSKVRDIFHRPQAFSGISEQTEARLAKARNIKKWILRVAITGGIALVLLLAILGFRMHLKGEVRQISAYAKSYFDQHAEIATRWERMMGYPSWLLPHADEIEREAAFHRQLAFLGEIEDKVRQRNATDEQLILWQKRLEDLIPTDPPARVRTKSYEVLLAIRSLQLLNRLLRDASANISEEEMRQLNEMEQEIKKELPVFTCPLLEEVKKATERQ